MTRKIFIITLCATIISCNTDRENYANHLIEQDQANYSSNTAYITTEMNGQQVIFEKIDGQLIFQGDIVIDEKQLRDSQTRGAGIYPWSPGKWTDNKIYYVIDSSIPNTTSIKAAIKDWQQNSNLIFFPRSNQANYIKFVRSLVNNSNVGMKGGEQIINLHNYANKGTVIHEIGHALGLWHEHTRADRDHYIIINWSNIKKEKWHNFNKYSTGMDYGPFDFNSIMIYDSHVADTNFVYNVNIPVMTKLNGDSFKVQNTISDGDRYAIQTLYTHVRIYGNADWKPVPADYDRDGKADLSVKTNDGYWLIDYASNGFGKWDEIFHNYDGKDAIPVPADYDGDRKADLSIKNGIGRWYIDYAANGFGKWESTLSGYDNGNVIPVPADYDGDGKADLSIKRNDGQWYIDYSHNGFGAWDCTVYDYGNRDAIPVPADYDGDGKADLSVKDGIGRWYIDYAADGFGKWESALSGYDNGNVIPVPADYDRDGKADLSIKRNDGQWYIDYSHNGFGAWDCTVYDYGNRDAIPVPADYDGDGKADLSVKDGLGRWCIDYATDGFGTWNWASSN